MVRSKRFLGYVCGAIAAFAIGCGPGMTNPDGGDSSTPGDATPDTPQTGGMEYTYLVNSLAIDMDDTASMPHTGFNLDNLYSTMDDTNGCTFEDFTSSLDPDQNCPMPGAMGACAAMPNTGCMPGAANCRGGVDNRLPSLANTLGSMLDIRATLRDQINSNSLSLLLRVSDVNDLQNDSMVRVRLYAGYPTFNTGCNTVMPDREYTVSSDALMPGATSIDQALFNFTGSIVNGRLRIDGTGGSFMLPLPEVMGMRLVIQLRNPQLRMNLTAEAGSNGNLGGAVNGREVIDTVSAAAPMYAPLVRSVIGNLIDIQPMPALSSGLCYDNMAMTYGGIGMGLGLTAVRARIRMENPISMTRPAGVCGSSSSSDN